MEIEYRITLPSKEQYFALFETTGWNQEYQASPDELIAAVSNSQYVVTAYEGETLIGTGRVVADGVLHAMIYEMIIHPDYQGRGIGAHILHELMGWCLKNQIRDIQLFCARGKRPFYEKNGFIARPEDGPGMQLKKRAP